MKLGIDGHGLQALDEAGRLLHDSYGSRHPLPAEQPDDVERGREPAADVPPDSAPGAGMDGPPVDDSGIPPIDTHWMRILFYDLFDRDAEADTPITTLHKEISVATAIPNHDGGSRRISYPVKAAAALLGIYATMHLAVGGILHVLAWPDAAAATATYGLVTLPRAPAASTSPDGPGELRARDFLERGAERTDGSRECTPNEAIESNCIFN